MRPQNSIMSHDGDARFKLDHLSALLDTFVAMHWDLNNGLHDGADLPTELTDRIRIVDNDLQATILTLKMLIRDRELPS